MMSPAIVFKEVPTIKELKITKSADSLCNFIEVPVDNRAVFEDTETDCLDFIGKLFEKKRDFVHTGPMILRIDTEVFQII